MSSTTTRLPLSDVFDGFAGWKISIFSSLTLLWFVV